jgi:hypothetical protein
MGLRTRTALGVALLAGSAGPGCESQTLDTPDPAVLPTAIEDTAAALPPSYVSAPITFDLRPVLSELENRLPRRIGSIADEDRVQVGRSPSVWLAAELERGAVRFAFGDSAFSVSTTFQYRGRAWVRALFASPSFSCGMDGPRPRMRVGIRTAWDVMPDWHLKTRSAVSTIVPVSAADRDRCEVSFLDIDVTGKVVDAAQKGLTAALRDADRALARLDLGVPVADLWATIQKPISIDDGRFWLVIGPEAVALSNLTARDSTIRAILNLRARPRIISGPRPPDGQLPLPDLTTLPTVDSALVFMEGVLDYNGANRILEEEVTGKSVRMGTRRIRIDSVAATYGGGGRIILAIDLRGRARGRIYLVGTPTYDPATDMISFPDLALDVNTRDYIDRTIGWFAAVPFIGFLRDRARFPASQLLDMAARLANEEIDRELTDGVWLRGSVGKTRPVQVAAHPDGIHARAFATADLRLDLFMQNIIPDEIPDPLQRGGASH